MRRNNKKKGFTIVELVIVIAVIAILAALLIPTFASIINRANESADIQAVRQMNIALMAESVTETPKTLKEVIKILAAAGYNAKDKLVPVSTGHGFYWCKSANLIALIKDEGANTPELIFPLDNETLKGEVTTAASDWAGALAAADPVFYDLEDNAEDILEEIEKEASAGEATNTETVDPLLFVLQKLETEGSIDKGTYTSTNGTSVTVSEGEGRVTITLGGVCTIDEPVEINGNVSIDLKGKKLTITDKKVTGVEGDAWENKSDVITISDGASLSITNSGDGGGLVLDEDKENAVGNNSLGSTRYAGISVEKSVEKVGSLNISGVAITGNRGVNIINRGTVTIKEKSEFTLNGKYAVDNYGTVNIIDSTYIADGGNGGFGFFNNPGDIDIIKIVVQDSEIRVLSGCGFYNNGGTVDFSIKKGSTTSTSKVIAAGEGVTPLYNFGGNVTINGATFSELTEDEEGNEITVSYGSTAPIFSVGGNITLNDVSVEVSNTSGSVYATSGATIDINGGEFTGKIQCSSNSSFTIKKGVDGTFNGTNFADPDTVATVQSLLNPNCTVISTADSTGLKAITITDEFAYEMLDGVVEYAKSGELTIPAGYTVTMHLNPEGVKLTNNLNVIGTLNIKHTDANNAGQLYGYTKDENKEEPNGRFIVVNGAELNISAGMLFYIDGNNKNDDERGYTEEFFFALFATVENEGRFNYNDTPYNGDLYTPTT